MKPAEHLLDVRGLKIHYVEWGEPDSQPLILVHGFLDHARSWDPFVRHLQETAASPFRIIALDCRGHGDSGWVGPGGYYHFADYIFDLHTLIESLHVGNVILMGHSMGGSISFQYTGAFPKQVDKLILVEGLGPVALPFSDAPKRMEQWISEVRAAERREGTEYPTLEDAARRLQRQNPRLASDLALHLARFGMKQKENGNWIWKFDPLHRTTAPQPFYLGHALAFFHRIECPVLLVRGKESRQQHRTDLQERINAISHHTRVEIEAAGHMVHQDNPAQLAEVVVAFLQDRA